MAGVSEVDEKFIIFTSVARGGTGASTKNGLDFVDVVEGRKMILVVFEAVAAVEDDVAVAALYSGKSSARVDHFRVHVSGDGL